MKRFIFMILASNMFALHAADDQSIRNLILTHRTDKDDVTAVSRINFDNENITDEQLKQALTIASRLISFSANKHILNSPTFPYCASLTTLILSNGTLTTFPLGDALMKMPCLHKLVLSNNQIESIASDTDAAKNCRCAPQAPWKHTSLQELDLNGNLLTEFNMHIIENLPKLKKADFSDNPIARIAVPRQLNYSPGREVCSIKLKNSSLTDVTQKALVEHGYSYTKIAARLETFGILVGGISGGGTAVGLAFALCPTIGLWGIPPGVGLIALGTSAGLGLPYIALPADKRTYQAYVFDFGNSNASSLGEVAIDADSSSGSKN